MGSGTHAAALSQGHGLRLLSLDGGGIRGLSELVILAEVMKRIKDDEGLSSVPRPCDYFDLIGGTSTGGLIALMLGRLHLTVEEAIDHYCQFAKKVFSERKWTGQDGMYKATNLENAIKDIVRSSGLEKSADEQMMDTRPGNEVCRTFVCAMPAHNISGPRLFRTYSVRESQGYNCTIWQAARATSAAPTFFKRIRFGVKGAEEEFVDGGLRCNNPVKQVLEEAESVFGPDRYLACLVSIGTGQAEVIGLQSPNAFQRALPLKLITALKQIVTDCELVAEDIEKRFRHRTNIYFRLNVDQGLQRVTLEEWNRLGEVTTHTQQYIQKSVVSQKINAVVDALRRRPAVAAITESSGPVALGQTMPPSASLQNDSATSEKTTNMSGGESTHMSGGHEGDLVGGSPGDPVRYSNIFIGHASQINYVGHATAGAGGQGSQGGGGGGVNIGSSSQQHQRPPVASGIAFYKPVLPPPPELMIGRDKEKSEIVDILVNKMPAHVAILGGGGMGKTTLTLSALHDPLVINQYPYRFFVSCKAAPSVSTLIWEIADVLRVPPARRNEDLIDVILSSFHEKTVLCLDNFNTTWDNEMSRSDVEDILSHLSHVSQLTLVITMRGTQRPSRVSWSKPLFPVLKKLSDTSSKQIYEAICGEVDESVEKLLREADGVPLAVTLIAKQR